MSLRHENCCANFLSLVEHNGETEKNKGWPCRSSGAIEEEDWWRFRLGVLVKKSELL